MLRNLVLASLLLVSAASFAEPVHVGAGFYIGPTCVLPFASSCSPNPTITSPALNVSFDNGNHGYATLAAGWIEANDWDADGGTLNCNTQGYMGSAYGTVNYNDGTLSYSGAAKFEVVWADTSIVPLPSNNLCCWQSHNSYTQFMQPNNRFIRKLRIRSCTNNHVLTNKFIAYGCDGYTESSFVNDPNCPFMNTNWINLTVSGF